MKREQLFSGVKRVVVKVGTNVLTSENGNLDRGQIESLCVQISELVKSKREVVLVSSGAVAAGRRLSDSGARQRRFRKNRRRLPSDRAG